MDLIDKSYKYPENHDTKNRGPIRVYVQPYTKVHKTKYNFPFRK